MTRVQDLLLADPRSLADLDTFLRRARRIAPGAAVHVQSAGGLLAVSVPVLDVQVPAPVPAPAGPGTLGRRERSVVVLGVRAASLRPGPDVDRAVPLAAVADRLARPAGPGARPVLRLPGTDLPARWAAYAVPRAGWRPGAGIPAGTVAEEARRGMDEVAGLLPRDAGAPVVAAARARVWGGEWRGAGAPYPPRGMAFAAVSLGFVGPGAARDAAAEPLALRTAETGAGRWWRLSTRWGEVVALLAD